MEGAGRADKREELTLLLSREFLNAHLRRRRQSNYVVVMHAPLDDSAADLDPASIHRIEGGHAVAVNLRRSLSPALDCTLCRCQSTAPELSKVDCRTPGGVKAT